MAPPIVLMGQQRAALQHAGFKTFPVSSTPLVQKVNEMHDKYMKEILKTLLSF